MGDTVAMAVRVLIAGGRDGAREGLRTILEAADELEVVGSVPIVESGAPEVVVAGPDVCLLDLDPAGVDGVVATGRVLAEAVMTGARPGRCRMVAVTDDVGVDEAYLILAAGALGLVSRGSAPVLLVEAVLAAGRDQSLISPTIATQLINRLRQLEQILPQPVPAPARPIGGPLTGREEEILAAVAQGLTNMEIANRLHVSVSTVKTHIAGLMAKLHARNRVELTMWAFRTGRVR